MDDYDVNARLQPGFLVALPAVFTAMALFGGREWYEQAAGAVASLIVSAGISRALVQIVRQAGRRIEHRLFGSWGGPPTTRGLRHRGSVPEVQLRDRHKEMARLFPDCPLPTEGQELADPAAADRVYAEVVRRLRDLTRGDAFVLIRQEERNYGFARNTLGVRPWGMGFAVVAIAVLLAVIAAQSAAVPEAVWAALGANLLALTYWLGFVTDDRARLPAEAYATALFGAAASVPSPRTDRSPR